MAFSLTKVNKKWLLICLHFVVIFCSFDFSSSFVINGTEMDRLALLEFKAKLTDSRGIMNSWNDTTHVCDWFGVTCHHRHQRVTKLNLRSSQLVGSISPSIGNMSFLRDVRLVNNSFNGKLPSEIGRLRRLRILVLSNNSIHGEIPSNISRCSKLIALILEGNSFSGEIPKELGFLSNLLEFSLTSNNLIGRIPPSLGNLTFLRKLFIAKNHITGNIPDSFGRFINLIKLVLYDNQLSGMFLPSILNMSSLSSLDLGRNQFYGNLPSKLGTSLSNLKFFGVVKNSFNGSFPTSIVNASGLEQLFITHNQFTGKIPSLKNLERLFRLGIGANSLGFCKDGDLNFISSLANATKLKVFVIDDNNLGGVLPKTIGNLSTKLEFCFMDNNMISGSIPIEIENLVGLQIFEVWNNNLLGHIPKNIGKLQNLRRLPMQGNMLLGSIPFSLGNLTRLIEIDLSNNNLQGRIPKSISQCQQLLSFDLGVNNLSGEVPIELFNFSSLSIDFSLNDNQLSGSLPSQVQNLKNLGILDFSENKLSGDIPDCLGSLKSLEALYMEGNLFQGSIPSSLGLLKGLRALDLSRNNLSGEIPEYFITLKVQQLNLSYNNFQGKVPIDGIFGNASVVSVVGNNRLCGGIQELKLQSCDFKISKKRHSWRFVIIIVSSCFGLIIISLVVFGFWFRKKKNKPSSSQPFSIISWLELSYYSLFKATNGFSSENLIGTGSFGSVYKGQVNELGGTIVAVKVMNLYHKRAFKSFIVECDALRNIRHRNLVKVLTVCSSIDNHGNEFKALVYEFMENGSLENWLHLPSNSDKDDPPRHMNFSCRLNIIIDVALALDYLHHHCGATVVHCDLKPSDILLDGEMIAHVGDFGLAKFLSRSILNTPIPFESSSYSIQRTIGYAPPEYAMENQVSTCGDVYSFGIILLEIFTGKRPIDDAFKSGQDLHMYCKETIPEKLVKILDPTLVEELFGEENRSKGDQRVIDNLTSLFMIGISCSAVLPKDRPSISDVAKQLCVIRNKIFLEYRI